MTVRLSVLYHKRKDEGNDQESIQSNATPDPGHHMGNTAQQTRNTNNKNCPQKKYLTNVVTTSKADNTFISNSANVLSQLYEYQTQKHPTLLY